MTVWFTVRLEDKPGSLARVAAALGERGVNIAGIVGVAEDTEGALMLETSNAEDTIAALTAVGVPFEVHSEDVVPSPADMTVADIQRTRS